MSRDAETASMNVRRRQQRRVAALLDEIAVRRQRLYVLKAYGARPAGLQALKAELRAVRDELADATNAATPPRVPVSSLNPRKRNRQVVPARRAGVAQFSPRSARPA
jgi:hypothetical protein